jgi:minor histocompatibility antigen H13
VSIVDGIALIAMSTVDLKAGLGASTQDVSRMSSGVMYSYLIIAAVTALGQFRVIPVSVHMILISCAIIYIGSYNSVSGTKGEAGYQKAEQMQTQDVMRFPLVGSAVLFSLFLVFKFLPKEYVNFVVKIYFCIFGFIVVSQKLSQLLGLILPVNIVRPSISQVSKIDISFINKTLDKLSSCCGSSKQEPAQKPSAAASTDSDVLELNRLDIIACIFSAVFTVVYLYFNHWIASNVLGVCFALQGIEMLGLGSYFNGVILLCGLFVYDIFWVFFTPVMVTVAKSFDAPIKLLFPIMNSENNSMLGLGDIVIPGIFVALLLRLDILLNKKNSKNEVETYYFNFVMLGYAVGLLTTILVMYYFQAAQPALLYLVPAVFLFSIVPAYARNELNVLLKFDENPELPVPTSVPAQVDTSSASQTETTSQAQETKSSNKGGKTSIKSRSSRKAD